MFGNILFGGGIGAIVDHSNGKAYDYPGWVKVIMGEHLIFDRKDEKKNTVLSGTPISTDALDKIQQAKAQDMKAAQKRVDEEKVKAVN